MSPSSVLFAIAPLPLTTEPCGKVPHAQRHSCEYRKRQGEIEARQRDTEERWTRQAGSEEEGHAATLHRISSHPKRPAQKSSPTGALLSTFNLCPRSTGSDASKPVNPSLHPCLEECPSQHPFSNLSALYCPPPQPYFTHPSTHPRTHTPHPFATNLTPRGAPGWRCRRSTRRTWRRPSSCPRSVYMTAGGRGAWGPGAARITIGLVMDHGQRSLHCLHAQTAFVLVCAWFTASTPSSLVGQLVDALVR